MNEYEELMFKSEMAKQNAKKSETDWASNYWTTVAEKLEEKALSLPLSVFYRKDC